jgi:hypothetical protein
MRMRMRVRVNEKQNRSPWISESSFHIVLCVCVDHRVVQWFLQKIGFLLLRIQFLRICMCVFFFYLYCWTSNVWLWSVYYIFYCEVLFSRLNIIFSLSLSLSLLLFVCSVYNLYYTCFSLLNVEIEGQWKRLFLKNTIQEGEWVLLVDLQLKRRNGRTKHSSNLCFLFLCNSPDFADWWTTVHFQNTDAISTLRFLLWTITPLSFALVVANCKQSSPNLTNNSQTWASHKMLSQTCFLSG